MTTPQQVNSTAPGATNTANAAGTISTAGITGPASAPDRASTADTTCTPRSILDVSPPLQPMPGSGMDGRLVIGPGSGLADLDPFPALMHDDVPPWVHFPMHPHRGVEIITYGLGGALHHEDSLGNSGTVVPGGVERNLFGRGYHHSEAPVGDEPYRGLQLFSLLSDANRHLAPTFQLLEPGQVPEVHQDEASASVRIIAGEYDGQRSPLSLRNPTLYLDVQLAPATPPSSLTVPIPADYAGIAYVLSGAGQFGTPPVAAAQHQRLLLGPGDHLTVTAQGNEPLRFVLITGRPIYG